MRVAVLLVVPFLMVPAAARAQVSGPIALQAAPALPQTPPELVPHRPEKNPYARLFRVPNASGLQAARPLPTPPWSDGVDRRRAEIICGMTVWHVDASKDPRMVIRPKPRDVARNVEPKIRKLEPPVCNEPTQR